MGSKIYVSADAYLRDVFRLARRILDAGWMPADMIVLWPGGAPVGMGIHEFLYYHGFRPRHRVLKCQSYTGIESRRQEVTFEGAEAVFGSVVAGSRVLVVDDVFDSGSTARAVLDRLAPLAVDARFAAVYWKPDANRTELKPDFFIHETDRWIVFPHELDGLTPDEVKEKDPAIHALLFDGITV
jgi:hypoxanthine phosphoribosyltransferase